MSATPGARAPTPAEKSLKGQRFAEPGETPVDAGSTLFVHSTCTRRKDHSYRALPLLRRTSPTQHTLSVAP